MTSANQYAICLNVQY